MKVNGVVIDNAKISENVKKFLENYECAAKNS